jgi:hypothetical protein
MIREKAILGIACLLLILGISALITTAADYWNRYDYEVRELYCNDGGWNLGEVAWQASEVWGHVENGAIRDYKSRFSGETYSGFVLTVFPWECVRMNLITSLKDILLNEHGV